MMIVMIIINDDDRPWDGVSFYIEKHAKQKFPFDI